MNFRALKGFLVKFGSVVAGVHGGELGAVGHGGELCGSVFDDGPAVGQHQGEWVRRNFL